MTRVIGAAMLTATVGLTMSTAGVETRLRRFDGKPVAAGQAGR